MPALTGHTTGRADFPHPAFRLAHREAHGGGPKWSASEVKDSEGAEHRLPWEAAGAVRGHLVTSNQEVPEAVVDVIVDRPIRWQPGAIAEVCAPASL
jgi:hypothetical protein